MRRLGTRTNLGLALAALSGTAIAQTSRDVTVTTTRMPQAEAPRSSTCEMLARDPRLAAQIQASGGNPIMGPPIYLPTRLPRNPDYAAPPLVPPGSPIPAIPKSRFGVSDPVFGDQPGTGVADSAEDIDALVGADASPAIQTVLEQSIDICRGLYQGGSASPGLAWSGPLSQAGSRGGAALDRLNARAVQGRANIARNDTTLPTAFALFDQRRFAEALPYFQKAAAKLPYRDGGDEAALFVGKIYLQGLGAASDPREGIKWLEKAATMPFNPTIDTPIFDPAQPERTTAAGEAATMLANIYRTGFGVPRTMAEACRWYERAEAVGHVPAAKKLGDIYLAGDGVPRDPRKAAKYYRRAAQYDLTDAQVALAGLLASGDTGVARDSAGAVDWYRAAARKNNGPALFALARAYDLGQGVTADAQRALRLYKAAALTGLPEAKVAMGTYFHEGTLVAKDEAVARKWFEAAAKDRDVDGMYNLAALMANGSGGPRDLPGAMTWLQRAAAGGHAQAPAAIAKLRSMMGSKG